MFTRWMLKLVIFWTCKMNRLGLVLGLNWMISSERLDMMNSIGVLRRKLLKRLETETLVASLLHQLYLTEG